MMKIHFCFSVMLLLTSGCVSNAPMEMAAATALQCLADQMTVALGEYHQEVFEHDDFRESAVVSAFIDRVKNDIDNPPVVESHENDFRMALHKIRNDRQVEWSRHHAALSNVAIIKEVATGLQRTAVDSLSLQDEMRRYLNDWMNLKRKLNNESVTGGE